MNKLSGTFRCPVCKANHPLVNGSADFICPNIQNQTGRKQTKARDVDRLDRFTRNAWNLDPDMKEDRYDERYIENVEQYRNKPVRHENE